ncbi:MAG: trimethylamine methyltransferase family protein [Candidatus Bathyarchaeia archaeon]
MGSLRVLNRDQLEMIHTATVKVLEEVGVFVGSRRGLKILGEAGAEIDFGKKIARIPETLLMEGIGRAPSGFVLASRNGRFDVRIEKGEVRFCPCGTPVHVLDLKTGERRESMKRDVADEARLVDALGGVAFHQPPTCAMDVPKEAHYEHEYEAVFKATEKHFMHGAPGGGIARNFIRMAALIEGGHDRLESRPIISLVICPISPLEHMEGNVDALMEFARARLPICVLSMPMAGAVSPVTVAGTLVVLNAENLSGILLAELTGPGTPVFYASNASIMDMRTGIASFGAPEMGLINAAVVQLADFYDLPSFVVGGTTDSKVPDVQAGYEKAATAMVPALAGANVIFSLGLIDSIETFSYEQLVIDEEIAGHILHVLEGVEITEETIALDLIERVGVGGTYLAERHTLKHLGGLWMPRLSVRVKGEAKEDMVSRAREKVMEVLSKHQPAPLEKDVSEAIEGIVGEAEKERLKKET